MKYSRRLLVVTMCVIHLTAAAAAAETLAPLAGLELLRKAFAGVNDFSARIVQEKQLSLMKKSLVARGQVRFKKPDVFYMELNPPYASRVLLKDSTVTMVVPDDGSRQIISLPPEQGLRRWFALLGRPVRELPDGFAVTADKRGEVISLRIVPRRAGAMKTVQVQFLENGALQKIVIEENNRDKTSITFMDVKKNLGLTERDFLLE
jgi:outer membrane lipoprotein carrier protein